jgi:glycolate oxidase FAD binding subunit
VDTAAGVSTPSEAWTPTTVAAVQEAVREAGATRTPVRIIGRGTWLDAGWPVAADARAVRLDALRGITQYTPGDLTLTALAGTPLSDIVDATAAEGQWLALDPFGDAEHGGTIGATFATASAGPLAQALGLPRDIALGLEVVTGDGEIVRAGGRVVKNVAGFDVTRLMTGAWGTLGVITEISVRLRARPEVDQTLAVARVGAVEAAADVATALRSAAVTPLAAELLNPALATRLGVTATGTSVLMLRLGGNAERVASEVAAVGALGDWAAIDGDVWRAMRRCEPPDSDVAVLRWSQLPGLVSATWRHVVQRCAGFPDALIHASLTRGVVRAILPHPDAAAVAAILRTDGRPSGGDAFVGARIAERLPAPLWCAEHSTVAADRLARRVRLAFDPWHILNPGVLGEATRDDTDRHELHGR